MEVTNKGPAPALGVVATITFPPKTSIQDPLGFLPLEGCLSSVVNGSPTLTCTRPSLMSGGCTKVDDCLAIPVILQLDLDYPWQDGLTATATVTSSTADPVPSNNGATVFLPVLASLPIPMLPAFSGPSLLLLIAALAFVGIVIGR